MKKGQGISVNMMILIIMGIIVLLISTMLVTKQFRKGDETLGSATDCPVLNCKDKCEAPLPEQDFRVCKTPGKVCCKAAST